MRTVYRLTDEDIRENVLEAFDSLKETDEAETHGFRTY